MIKYCVINSRRGRGGSLFRRALLLAAVILLSLASFPGDANSFTLESGSYNSLNLDSSKEDIFNVTQSVSDVVNEVVKDLTPSDIFSPGTNVPFNLPLNPLNHIQGFGIDLIDRDKTDLDIGGFFDPSSISSGDLLGILKGVALLSVQIFIVVVQVVWQIVQGLQGAVNS